MPRAKTKTYREQMVEICEQYRKVHGTAPFLPRDVGAWAVQNKLWTMPHSNIVTICAKHVRNALKSTMKKTPGGERVRAWLAAPVEKLDEHGESIQLYFWDHIDTSSRAHIMASLAYQRQQLVKDARAIKAQVDYVNANNPHCKRKPIRMLFDLTEETEAA